MTPWWPVLMSPCDARSYLYPTMDELADQLNVVMAHYNLKSVIGFGVGAGGNVLARFALLQPKKVILIISLGYWAPCTRYGHCQGRIQDLLAGHPVARRGTPTGRSGGRHLPAPWLILVFELVKSHIFIVKLAI